MNNFKPRNLIPAVLYAASSAVDSAYTLVYATKMQNLEGHFAFSLVALAVFVFTVAIAAVFFNFLDFIECGFWQMLRIDWYRGKRGAIVAGAGLLGAMYNVVIAAYFAGLAQMGAAATWLEIGSAAVFGFWGTALITLWIFGGPVTAESRKG